MPSSGTYRLYSIVKYFQYFIRENSFFVGSVVKLEVRVNFGSMIRVIKWELG